MDPLMVGGRPDAVQLAAGAGKASDDSARKDDSRRRPRQIREPTRDEPAPATQRQIVPIDPLLTGLFIDFRT